MLTSQNCDSIVTLNLIVLIDGISSSFESGAFNVYPNPFSETLTIKWNDSQKTNVKDVMSLSFVIIDLLGKEIIQQQITQSYFLLNDGIILDVSYLKKGAYLLEIKESSIDKVISRDKIIKQ